MKMQLVKFRYSDGYMKTCSAKEAELLCKMRRGAIMPAAPAPEAEKPAKRKKVSADEVS